MLRSTSGIQYSGGGIGLKAAGVLAQSAVASSVTGTATETTLATITIPANAIGLNGAVRIWTRWTMTANTDVKTLRVKFGATDFLSMGISSAQVSVETLTLIQNRNVTNSQIGTRTGQPQVFGQTTSPFVTSAVDTTVAQNITITGQLGTTTDTLTLESYMVEILNP